MFTSENLEWKVGIIHGDVLNVLREERMELNPEKDVDNQDPHSIV